MKCRLFLLALLCLIPLAAFATPRSCPGTISVKGEWIYLRPILDDPYYFIGTDPSTSPARLRGALEPNFHSGVSVEGVYGFCCRPYTDVRAGWIYLSTCGSGDETVGLLQTVRGNSNFTSFPLAAGEARMDRELRLNRFESALGIQVLRCRCLNLTLEGGAQYAYLSDREDVFYRSGSTTAIADANRKYWGVGPQFGLDLRCGFLRFLSLDVFASGALLVGKSNADFFQQLSGTYDVNNKQIWRIVPSTYIRAGLSLSVCLFRIGWSVGGGYQLMHYGRALDQVWFPGGTIFQTNSVDSYSDADFHGPYVSVTGRF